MSLELRHALAEFDGTLSLVEEAKASLAAAAPRGRSAGAPLAEALAAFEQGLREAVQSMPRWRHPELSDEWTACLAALGEAQRRSERLRLGPAPEGYEQLYGRLGDLMDPLDAFDSAAALVIQLSG